MIVSKLLRIVSSTSPSNIRMGGGLTFGQTSCGNFVVDDIESVSVVESEVMSLYSSVVDTDSVDTSLEIIVSVMSSVVASVIRVVFIVL